MWLSSPIMVSDNFLSAAEHKSSKRGQIGSYETATITLSYECFQPLSNLEHFCDSTRSWVQGSVVRVHHHHLSLLLPYSSGNKVKQSVVD